MMFYLALLIAALILGLGIKLYRSLYRQLKDQGFTTNISKTRDVLHMIALVGSMVVIFMGASVIWMAVLIYVIF